MDPQLLIRIILGAAVVYAVTAFGLMLRRTKALSRGPRYAEPVGSESAGVRYAFFNGMMPSAKESVQKHLPTFLTGIVYHLGTLVAIANLALLACRISLGPTAGRIIEAIILAGLGAGVALLIKRISLGAMRLISTPDDFIANILVDLFLAASMVVSIFSAYEILLFGLAIALLLYIPVGKIRHCVFFFYTRIVFGTLFGRRGVFPRPSGESRAGTI